MPCCQTLKSRKLLIVVTASYQIPNPNSQIHRLHLSFNVVSANSASTSPAIQNRAMIFDSVPAQRLEMMMQRRHLENALACAA